VILDTTTLPKKIKTKQKISLSGEFSFAPQFKAYYNSRKQGLHGRIEGEISGDQEFYPNLKFTQ